MQQLQSESIPVPSIGIDWNWLEMELFRIWLTVARIVLKFISSSKPIPTISIQQLELVQT